MSDRMRRFIEFVNFQMTAEAFSIRRGDDDSMRPANNDVPNRIAAGKFLPSRFTPTQTAQFVRDYEVLAQNRSEAALTAFDAFFVREAN